jgi:hypothetical protein
MTHCPGKIEYNCRYFIMSFRTQIHQKKFCKNGFHTLQGTMSHRPLTNSSSLKITAAYWTNFRLTFKSVCGLISRSMHNFHLFYFIITIRYKKEVVLIFRYSYLKPIWRKQGLNTSRSGETANE